MTRQQNGTTMEPCVVCGSTGTILRTPDPDGPQTDAFTVCYAHLLICRQHFADPCPICDTT